MRVRCVAVHVRQTRVRAHTNMRCEASLHTLVRVRNAIAHVSSIQKLLTIKFQMHAVSCGQSTDVCDNESRL